VSRAVGTTSTAKGRSSRVQPPGEHDPWDARPNPEPIYFAVTDLDAVENRATAAGATIDPPIARQPWGKRSFYLRDP
jgi:uncharacterized glyoxalase superfamily protein PhnB